MMTQVKESLKRGRKEKGEGTNPFLPGWRSHSVVANRGAFDDRSAPG
jgi:hypothetical protein